jgi:hypothetical protein
MRLLFSSTASALFLSWVAAASAAGEDEWTDLSGLKPWKSPSIGWKTAASVKPDEKNARRLSFEPGEGTIVNGAAGRAPNLVSKETYGDVEMHIEFMVPKGSNSGVKFEGLYEVQIADSFGVEKPKASDCGGIYPRAELLPKYHHIDDGYPPRTNASRAPGQWQTLDVIFRAPRFDPSGKKVANARFDKVVLNGQVVQEGVELASPTGHAWRNKEVATGPILLQGDHGPVAFRGIRVRRLSSSAR